MHRRARSPEDAPPRQRIGPTIKALRLDRGLSLNALAAEAGISQSHLSRMERGLTVPSYDVLDHVADALGSDLRVLRQAEEHALVIDAELNETLTELGIAETTLAELLCLSHRARADLVETLRRGIGERLPSDRPSDL